MPASFVAPSSAIGGGSDVVRDADPDAVAPGTWYFDTRERALVYVVRFPEQFLSGIPGRPRARFRVEPDFDDLDGDGRFDPARDAARGLRLVALEPYRWRDLP